MELNEQARMILTEKELSDHLSYIERHKSTIHQEVVKSLLNNIGYSHKALTERCRLLVLENEALNSENYILKEGESP